MNDSRVAIIISEPPKPKVAIAQQILRGQRGANADGVGIWESFTPALNQTIFNLQHNLNNPSLSQVFLNGQKVTYAIAYQISGSSSVMEWISSIPLEPTDTLEIFYQYL